MNQSASKTYTREFLAAMATYVVVLPVCILLIIASPHSAWWRIPLALVPVIPILFAMRAFMRFFGYMDELQRRIQLEAFAFSFGVTGIVTFSYGLLTYVGFPAISWVWIFPLIAMQNRLKVLRAERNWSQAELAERLGVSRQTVNALETGKYDPSLPLTFKIAHIFQLPIEEIFQYDPELDGRKI